MLTSSYLVEPQCFRILTHASKESWLILHRLTLRYVLLPPWNVSFLCGLEVPSWHHLKVSRHGGWPNRLMMNTDRPIYISCAHQHNSSVLMCSPNYCWVDLRGHSFDSIIMCHSYVEFIITVHVLSGSSVVIECMSLSILVWKNFSLHWRQKQVMSAKYEWQYKGWVDCLPSFGKE